MLSLLNFVEKYEYKTYDIIQNIILNHITSIFLPWTLLALVLNDKKQNKNKVKILIIYWFLKASGDVLYDIADTFPISDNEKTNNYWPYTFDRWFIGSVLASIFRIIGEIICDWYLYLRVKAIIPKSKRKILILIICIFYNIAKIVGISSFFIIFPADCRKTDENGKPINKLLPHTIVWWSSILASSFINLLYNFSTILCIKT